MTKLTTFYLFVSLLAIAFGQFLYHDGLIVENIPFLEGHHVYNYDSPKSIDLNRLLGTNKLITDIQFASNYFIFVQAGNELYILCYNFSNVRFRYRAHVPVYVKLVHNDVDFFRIKSLDENGHVHLFIVCDVSDQSAYVTIDYDLILDGDIPFSTYAVSFKEASIYDNFKAYFVDNLGNVRNTTYVDGFLGNLYPYPDLKSLDYPAFSTETELIYLANGTLDSIPGDVPYKVMASQGFNDQQSFIGFFDTGDINGFNTPNHPLFVNDCGLNAMCPLSHPQDNIDAIAYTPKFGAIVDQGDLYLYISMSTVKQYQLKGLNIRAWKGYESKRNINDSFKLSLRDSNDPVVLCTFGTTTWQLNALLHDRIEYTLEPITYGFKSLNHALMDASQVYLFDKELYYLHRNGSLMRSNDVYQHDVLGCVTNSISMMCWSNNTVYQINHAETFLGLTIDNVSFAWEDQLDFFVHYNNQSIGLFMDKNNAISYRSTVDNAWVDNSRAVYQKESKLYCSPTMSFCCNHDRSGTPLVFERDSLITMEAFPMVQGVLEGKTIKDVKALSSQIFFLTTDGYLYTCGEYGITVIEHIQREAKGKREDGAIRLIDDLNINGKICSIYSTSSHTIYIQLCKTNEVYTYGFRPNEIAHIGEDGYVQPKEIVFDYIRKLEESPRGYKIKSIASEGPSVYLLYENTCTEEICAIDELNGDGGNIVLPNSTVIIVTGPSEIGNTTVIVNNGTTVIIEDSLTVSNSTIIYQIPTQDILDGIKNGDRIVIIDASEGHIDGEFDEIILDYEKDACKELTATLEQNNKEVAIVFYVKDTCGFPIWAIILIVIGVVLIATVVTLILLRKKLFKSHLRHVKSRDTSQSETKSSSHNNEIYESSTKTYRNPTFNT